MTTAVPSVCYVWTLGEIYSNYRPASQRLMNKRSLWALDAQIRTHYHRLSRCWLSTNRFTTLFTWPEIINLLFTVAQVRVAAIMAEGPDPRAKREYHKYQLFLWYAQKATFLAVCIFYCVMYKSHFFNNRFSHAHFTVAGLWAVVGWELALAWRESRVKGAPVAWNRADLPWEQQTL